MRLRGRKMNCKSVNVVIHNNKDPINVRPNEKGVLQELKIEGNLLTITGGNTVQLPIAETTALNKINDRLTTAEGAYREINNNVAQMNATLSEDIYYLKESIKYFQTADQVKNIIDTLVGTDIWQLRNYYNDMFEEQEMINNNILKVKTDISGLKQSTMTQQQVKSLIDDELGKLVNAEEVRY